MDSIIKKQIHKVIDAGSGFVEIRSEVSNSNVISMKDNEIDKYVLGSDLGFGVRVLYKNAWGFASCTSQEDIENTVNLALKSAKATSSSSMFHKDFLDTSAANEDTLIVKPKISPKDIDLESKMNLISDISRSSFDYDDKIKSVTVFYSDNNVKKGYINSEGSKITQEYFRLRLATMCTSKDSDNLQMGYERIGAVALNVRLRKYHKPCPNVEFHSNAFNSSRLR